MAIEVERLIATLEAKVDKYEKNLAKASGTSDRTFKKIEDRGKLMETRLAKIGVKAFAGFASGALAAALPLVTLSAAINKVRSALDDFGQIADQSAAAGVDPEFFQGLAFNARLAGIDIGEVAGALATFNKNSGMASAGQGRLLSALKNISPELVNQIALAKTQEQRILAVADAIAAQTDVSRQAAIATAAFGDQGTKLVSIFRGGATSVEEFVRKAKEIGVVVDRDLIARADELGDKFDTAQQIIDVKLKSAAVSLAPALSDLASFAADFARWMAIAYEQTKKIEERQYILPLQNELAGVTNQRAELKQQIQEFEQEIAALGSTGAPGMLNEQLSQMQTQFADLTAHADKLLTRIQALQGKGVTPAKGAPPAAPSSPNTMGDAGLDLLDLNLPSPGQLEEVTTGVRSVASAIGDELKPAVESADEAAARLLESMRAYNAIAERAGSSLADALSDGTLEAEELRGILFDVVAQLAKIALSTLFPGGNIFTSFLGGMLGGFASGTANTGGGKGQVRGVVHGQEAVIPLPNGGRVPVEVRAPAGMAGGQPTRIVLEVQEGAAFTTRILEVAGPQSVAISGRSVSQYDRALPSRSAEQDARYR